MRFTRVNNVHTHHMAQVSACARHSIFMPSMMSGWAFVPRCSFVLTLSVCLSFTYVFSSHFYLYSDLDSFFHVDNAKANNPCASANRGVLPLGRIHSSHTRRRLQYQERKELRANVGKRPIIASVLQCYSKYKIGVVQGHGSHTPLQDEGWWNLWWIWYTEKTPK